jgi:hypothetical protein
LTHARFRLYPFRSPLLRASLLFSLPPGTEMFQFPGFPTTALYIQAGLTGHDPSRVSPFGHRWIDGWLAPPQRLSQLPTSFIGSRCQGIHRVLFHTCRTDARARYEVLKDHHTHTHAGAARTNQQVRSLKAAQDANTHQPDHPHPHTHHSRGRSRDLERPRSDMQLASGPQKQPHPHPRTGHAARLTPERR